MISTRWTFEDNRSWNSKIIYQEKIKKIYMRAYTHFRIGYLWVVANRPIFLAVSPSHTRLGPTTLKSVSKSDAFCRRAKSSASGEFCLIFVGFDRKTSNASENSLDDVWMLLFKWQGIIRFISGNLWQTQSTQSNVICGSLSKINFVSIGGQNNFPLFEIFLKFSSSEFPFHVHGYKLALRDEINKNFNRKIG